MVEAPLEFCPVAPAARPMLAATMRSPSLHQAAASLALAVAACRSPVTLPVLPLRAPDVEVIAGHYAGTPLSGARVLTADEVNLSPLPADSAPASESTVQPWILDCELLYLEDLPPLGVSPLAPRADLVADLRGGAPLLPSASLGADADILVGSPAASFLTDLRGGASGRWLALAGGPTALPAGSTYALDALALEAVPDPVDFLGEFSDRGPIPRRVGLRLGHPSAGGALRVALVLQDLDPEQESLRLQQLAEAGAAAPLPPMAPEDELVRMELLRVADSYDPGMGALVLIVPSPFAGGNGRAFALVVEPRTAEESTIGGEKGPSKVAASALARAAASSERASRAATLEAPSTSETQGIELEAALTAMQNGSPRSALLLLTERTGAALAGDLAITLTRSDLQAMAGSLFEEQTPAQLARTPRSVPLTLERAAYSLLLGRALEGSIQPEQASLLHLHTGALGPFPDALKEILRQASDLADLESRLTAENLTFLEDSSSASRLRAHDWLRARGRSIEGFDPLAERDARRAVLEAARSAKLAPADSTSGAPSLSQQ